MPSLYVSLAKSDVRTAMQYAYKVLKSFLIICLNKGFCSSLSINRFGWAAFKAVVNADVHDRTGGNSWDWNKKAIVDLNVIFWSFSGRRFCVVCCRLLSSLCQSQFQLWVWDLPHTTLQEPRETNMHGLHPKTALLPHEVLSRQRFCTKTPETGFWGSVTV